MAGIDGQVQDHLFYLARVAFHPGLLNRAQVGVFDVIGKPAMNDPHGFGDQLMEVDRYFLDRLATGKG